MNEESSVPTTPEEEDVPARWNRRLQNAEPIVGYAFDDTLTVMTIGTGELILDCSCFRLMGHDRAGIVRVALMPEATHILRQAFATIERNPDKPVIMQRERPVH